MESQQKELTALSSCLIGIFVFVATGYIFTDVIVPFTDNINLKIIRWISNVVSVLITYFGISALITQILKAINIKS